MTEKAPEVRGQKNGDARISAKFVGIVMTGVFAIPSVWLVTAKTFEPRIPLSSASTYLDEFYRTSIDPTKSQTVWDTMVTENYRKYVGLTYPKFAEFWGREKMPSIVHVSKDGDQTFAECYRKLTKSI